MTMFAEGAFDGVERESVRRAIAVLKKSGAAAEKRGDWEACSRLDVVAQALRDTLNDDSIDWADAA